MHYLACDVYNVALDRAAALVVLRSIMDAEETTFGAHQCEADDGGGAHQCEADDGGGGFDFAAGSLRVPRERTARKEDERRGIAGGPDTRSD